MNSLLKMRGIGIFDAVANLGTNEYPQIFQKFVYHSNIIYSSLTFSRVFNRILTENNLKSY